MELWIRSQDKERLMKATDIRIYYAKEENIWVIEDCDNLGYYQTKERALEVLDEIQNILKPKLVLSNVPDDQKEKICSVFEYEAQTIQSQNDIRIEQINSAIFYEMPKE